MNPADSTYKKFAGYYDLYAGLFTADFSFYKSLISSRQHVLEVGCGTGRVVDYLLKTGIKVTGVDISEEMLAVARMKLHDYLESNQLRLLKHDFQDAPFHAGKYDLVLISFYTFNYILNNPVSFLQHVKFNMAPGALLALDLFIPQSLLNPAIDSKWTNKSLPVSGREIKLEDFRQLSANIEKRIQVYREGEELTEIETLRKYYSPLEMKEILQSAELSDVKFYRGYDFGQGFEPGTEMVSLSNYMVLACNSPDS